MNTNCKDCIMRQDNNYEEAIKHFDKALNKATNIQLVCISITFISLLVTTFTIEHYIKVMESYEIKQNSGNNTAIISNDESEVKFYETY